MTGRCVLILLGYLCGAGYAWGYAPDRGAVLREQVNDRSIHSVHIGLAGWPLSAPVLQLDRMSTLLLTFDVVGESGGNFEYTLVHCDAEWRPSDLVVSDYIGGYERALVPLGKLSIATTTPFTHYQIQIPNGEMRPILSGNYAVVVFASGSPDRPVVVRHFMVLESLAVVRLSLHPTAGGIRGSRQRLEVEVGVSRLGAASSVARDMTVVTRQNWYSPCRQVHRQASGYEGEHTLRYGDAFSGLWPGGNEWRMLNLQTLRMALDRIEHIDRTDEGYQVGLRVDASRVGTPYQGERDLNGYWAAGYMGDWRRERGANQYEPLESDYVWVYFTYREASARADASTVYLQIGNQGEGGAGHAMRYNASTGAHEIRLRLKQGAYSYRYVQGEEAIEPDAGKDGSDCLSPCSTEGCHYATENEYHALVYYRAAGERYDRLVGWGKLGGSRE